MSNEQKIIVKQFIVIATFLLIQDGAKTINCTCVILDFIVLA